MDITYSLTVNDYLEFHARTMNQTPFFRFFRAIRWILIPVFALLLAVSSPFAHGDWRIVIALAMGIALVWTAIMVGMTRTGALQEYIHLPGAMDRRVLSLRPEEVSTETKGIVSRLLWRDVSEVAEERGYLVFRAQAMGLFTRRIIFFVPMRAFVSHEEAETFLAQARTYLASVQRDTYINDPPFDQDVSHQVSASYALMSGEAFWMNTQKRYRSRYERYRLGSFAGLFFLVTIYLVHSGRWDISAVIAFFFGLLVAVGKRTSSRGPLMTGSFALSVGDYRLILSPAGLEQHSPALCIWIPWSVVTQIEVKRRYFLFHAARVVICGVPPSAFGSAPEAEAFLNTARAFHQSALAGEAAPPVEQAQSWPPPPRR